MSIYLSSKKDELVAKEIVDSAYHVHKNLGPGLLEKIYEVCFCHELHKRGLKYQRQIDLPIQSELCKSPNINERKEKSDFIGAFGTASTGLIPRRLRRP
jgi:hypothetical protein